MNSQHTPPTSLKVAAYIFVAFGLLTVADLALSLSNMFWLHFGVFHLFIGVSLLRLTPTSWRWSMAAVWCSMAIIAALTALTSITPRAGYEFQGQPVELLPTAYGLLLGLVAFAICYWQYLVLIHYKTQRVFES